MLRLLAAVFCELALRLIALRDVIYDWVSEDEVTSGRSHPLSTFRRKYSSFSFLLCTCFCLAGSPKSVQLLSALFVLFACGIFPEHHVPAVSAGEGNRGGEGEQGEKKRMEP